MNEKRRSTGAITMMNQILELLGEDFEAAVIKIFNKELQVPLKQMKK